MPGWAFVILKPLGHQQKVDTGYAGGGRLLTGVSGASCVYLGGHELSNMLLSLLSWKLEPPLTAADHHTRKKSLGKNALQIARIKEKNTKQQQQQQKPTKLLKS